MFTYGDVKPKSHFVLPQYFVSGILKWHCKYCTSQPHVHTKYKVNTRYSHGAVVLSSFHIKYAPHTH